MPGDPPARRRARRPGAGGHVDRAVNLVIMDGVELGGSVRRVRFAPGMQARRNSRRNDPCGRYCATGESLSVRLV